MPLFVLIADSGSSFFSTKPTNCVRSISTGCPDLSNNAITKLKKLLLRRFGGGCLSKTAFDKPLEKKI